MVEEEKEEKEEKEEVNGDEKEDEMASGPMVVRVTRWFQRP